MILDFSEDTLHQASKIYLQKQQEEIEEKTPSKLFHILWNETKMHFYASSSTLYPCQ